MKSKNKTDQKILIFITIKGNTTHLMSDFTYMKKKYTPKFTFHEIMCKNTEIVHLFKAFDSKKIKLFL